MKNINVQRPCSDCELKDLLETPEGAEFIALEGLYMAVNSINALEACKHPWRLLYQIYNEEPTTVQQEIMGKTVQIRGKNPSDYNLPNVDKISTLDI